MNAQLHADKQHYGTCGAEYADKVRQLAREMGANSILDYGCGKRTLEKALGYSIANYDPAIPGIDSPPEPADLVICTDVLEHIEPDLLENVLDDLKRVTKGTLFATVCTQAAMKHFPDGRNAHLIIEDAEWWLPKLMQRFTLDEFRSLNPTFAVTMRAKGATQ